ncbi:DUF4189 domain-containing protein [Octadecabacter sp. G9-8]|uniref:DUF4189 domain-containing protein n=1 Tax=Octadecabacter dasysiphoniae TaxID=2909341 RepID=A0ABS9CYD7_9RHOB|nr:DUF4189 domain-containing protein [Octadecabacter dasysiphoniae]MCF2871839.1 DUF4189 domain-containing protein [Octadecabacter dasysiphoniae]
MIVEFALTLTFSLPNSAPPVVHVEFTQPVRQVVTYPPEGVLNQLSGLTLPERPFQEFQENFVAGQPYFGAFAITKDFGYGYVTGANSLEAAREIALEECLKQGPRCLIYAEILPQGYVPLEDGQISLAPEAGNYYNNPDPTWGNYRAMAISEDGAYSVVWNYGSPREASDAALSDCADYVITDLPELRPMPCMLIPFK